MKELGLSRHKRTITTLVVFFILVLVIFRVQPQPQATSSTPPSLQNSSPVNEGRLRQLLADLPLAFEINTGQAGPDVRFLARGPREQLLLSPGESALIAASSKFRFKFAGANLEAKIRGEQQLIERRNYLLGNDCSKWQTDVPTFRRVTYEDIYPGINLTYYCNQR
jgi:hypothetical protein